MVAGEALGPSCSTAVHSLRTVVDAIRCNFNIANRNRFLHTCHHCKNCGCRRSAWSIVQPCRAFVTNSCWRQRFVKFSQQLISSRRQYCRTKTRKSLGQLLSLTPLELVCLISPLKWMLLWLAIRSWLLIHWNTNHKGSDGCVRVITLDYKFKLLTMIHWQKSLSIQAYTDKLV